MPKYGKQGRPTDEAITLRCAREWSSDAELRAEFVDFENYLAYEKAVAAGLVKLRGWPRE